MKLSGLSDTLERVHTRLSGLCDSQERLGFLLHFPLEGQSREGSGGHDAPRLLAQRHLRAGLRCRQGGRVLRRPRSVVRVRQGCR